jgi:hypothetical protein
MRGEEAAGFFFGDGKRKFIPVIQRQIFCHNSGSAIGNCI